MKEIRQIIHAYEQARLQEKKAVLATVVHIEGSAYRAPGARMLITEDGALTGAVSGGCLEGDVLRKALLVMSGEQPLLITYDTSDEEDAVIGVSLGCNGIIRILLEPVRTGPNVIDILQQATATRQPAVLLTLFSPGDKKHPLQGTSLANNTIDIDKVLAGKTSSFVQYDATFTAFIEYIPPVPALVIAGAGNDVMPLAQLAAVLGWDVILADGRPAYANTTRFPGCQVLVTAPDKALLQVAVDEHTAVVLMSHNYHYDKAVLQQAAGSAAGYIGILGPHKKKERLLEELALSPVQHARIYGPTGLDIGAETPEEIALSIIAEIKAVFAGRSGTSLRGITGNIHQRQTQIAPSMQAYAVLLLAAGESKRLGSAKQELVYKGDTLLRHAVRTAQALNTAATVVVCSKATDQLNDLRPHIVINENHSEGMASSIREGVTFIGTQYPQVNHILVMLCDQPYVTTAHLQQLMVVQQLTGAPVTASYYEHRKGVPALFQASVFPQLMALQGDTGAKHLIESLGDAVATVPFPEGAIDIDTKEAYLQITGR